MRKILTAIFFMWLGAGIARASGPEALFDSANSAYARQDYTLATSLYDSLLQSGFRTAAVYYNLGNAWYKQENWVRAILNYERARKLAPEDEDIAWNLGLANLHVVDKYEPEETGLLNRWYEKFLRWRSAGGWAFLAIVWIWLAGISASVFLFVRPAVLKQILFVGSLFFLLLAVGSFSLSRQRIRYDRTHVEAIITAPNTYVKSEPTEGSLDLFILHAGAKVRILDETTDWVRIRFSSGKTGWMPAGDLEII